MATQEEVILQFYDGDPPFLTALVDGMDYRRVLDATDLPYLRWQRDTLTRIINRLEGGHLKPMQVSYP